MLSAPTSTGTFTAMSAKVWLGTVAPEAETVISSSPATVCPGVSSPRLRPVWKTVAGTVTFHACSVTLNGTPAVTGLSAVPEATKVSCDLSGVTLFVHVAV
jgi:hypothetical protein